MFPSRFISMNIRSYNELWASGQIHIKSDYCSIQLIWKIDIRWTEFNINAVEIQWFKNIWFLVGSLTESAQEVQARFISNSIMMDWRIDYVKPDLYPIVSHLWGKFIPKLIGLRITINEWMSVRGPGHMIIKFGNCSIRNQVENAL